MASCITEQFGNTYCPQVRLTVTQTSSSNTSVTLTWVLEYVAHGFAFYIGSRSYSVVINGSTVRSGTFAASGITGTAEIARGTKTINKTTSAQNISFSMSFAFNGSWNGVYGGTKSASGSISVAAKPSYKITYNANGGTGAPSAQTKWYGVNLTLSSSKPSRTGYSFLGWSTSSTATTATYSAGATYTANVSDTLYAVWKANTYTVKFNANGGSGAPANQTKTYGKTLTLSSTKPTRTNYNFKGWGTSASSTTVAYASGASYIKNEAITLYAIWELAYTPPRITDFSVDRCTSAGGLNEEGTYALVEFSWTTDKTVSSIKIEYKLQSASTYSTQYVTASGTSGAVRRVIGGSMDTEYLYNIRVTVSDSNGSSTSEKDVPAMAYIIDFRAGGKGVSFGKPAEIDGVDFKMDILQRSGQTFKKELSDGTQADIVTAISKSGYYGLINPSTGDDTGYLRTPSGGLLPNASGGSSRVGTNQWPFDYGYFKKIFANGRNICENKILWTGALYMTENQTATLSEAVSSQPNGICLVFCMYSNGAAQDYDYQIFFVPKAQVSSHLGAAHTFTMAHLYQEYFCCKGLRIHDTKITGDAGNDVNATGSTGIKYNNKQLVLRHVIGV